MKWVILVAFVVYLVQSSSLPPYLPNYYWLASGFDSRLASLTEAGEGVKAPIVDFSGQYLTPDQKWSVPAGVYVQELPTCSSVASTNTISGAFQYKEEVTHSISTSVGIGKLYSGSSSWEMTQIVETSAEFSSYSYDSFVICGTYQISFEPYEKFNLSSNFMTGVASLPSSFSPSSSLQEKGAFQYFFNSYGDSFISRAILGGWMGQRATTSSVSLAQLESQSIDCSYEAKVGFGSAIGIESSSGSGITTESYQQFSNNSTFTSITVFGGNPAEYNSFPSWANTIAESPVPISFILTPVSKWLTSKYFPNDPEIEQKADAYSNYVQWYFETTSSFVLFNPFFVINQESGSKFSITSTAYCPVGSIALSGGCTSFQNPQQPDPQHPWRISSSLPISGEGWQCTKSEDHGTGNYYSDAVAWVLCSEDEEVIRLENGNQVMSVDTYVTTCQSGTESKFWNTCTTPVCDDGYVLTGGGCSVSNLNLDQPWEIRVSAPNNNHSFTCTAGEDHLSGVYFQQVSGYGVCSLYQHNLTYIPQQLPSDYQIVTCSSPISGKFTNDCLARCPENYFAVGGGCSVPNSSDWESWRITTSQPQDNGWFCVGHEDAGTEIYNQLVTGYAICLQFVS